MSFIREISADDEAIGGKARSLARLAALGLPSPKGFVVATSAMRDLLARGPAPPAQLRTAADLAALDAARGAMTAAELPPELDGALAAAVAALQPRGPGAATFAVRSSAPAEDGADEAAPGIFDSVLRVPARDVARAVRAVLASALSPAAWAYGLRARTRTRGEIAVLVHEFVDGGTQGVVSCEGPARAGVGRPQVALDVQQGSLTSGARATLEAGAETAAARFGAVELEWTATGDDVTFLQLRPSSARAAGTGGAHASPATRQAEADGWTWDAAHNPTPLSPAQAGLVALVDERCVLEFRQRVVDGFLFWKREAAPIGARPPESKGAPSPGTVFADLSADVDAALATLGAAPPLEAALEVYVKAYGRLFGQVQPACAAARARLTAFLSAHLPEDREGWPRLFDDVPSAATRRRAAAGAIGAAPDPEARQAAVERYLAVFGDESPRWDVAETTLRETPQRLLLLGRGSAARRAPADEAAPGAGRLDVIERRLRERTAPGTWPAIRDEFWAAVAVAREAAAVAEDDDALFARMQAVVRAALLALGGRLVAARRLAEVDDVFFLPLALARALAAEADDDAAAAVERAPGTPSRLAPFELVPQTRNGYPASHSYGYAASSRLVLDAESRAILDSHFGSEALAAVAANGRAVFSAFATHPPTPPVPRIATLPDGGGRLVAGAGGARGRIIGRVVRHPPVVPLGPGDVLVAATLLPSELPLLDPAAIVVETGSPLGHVAAQARERGIPAVVGARGACAILREGQTVLVDGDRGDVVVLAED